MTDRRMGELLGLLGVAWRDCSAKLGRIAEWWSGAREIWTGGLSGRAPDRAVN